MCFLQQKPNNLHPGLRGFKSRLVPLLWQGNAAQVEDKGQGERSSQEGLLLPWWDPGKEALRLSKHCNPARVQKAQLKPRGKTRVPRIPEAKHLALTSCSRVQIPKEEALPDYEQPSSHPCLENWPAQRAASPGGSSLTGLSKRTLVSAHGAHACAHTPLTWLPSEEGPAQRSHSTAAGWVPPISQGLGFFI